MARPTPRPESDWTIEALLAARPAAARVLLRHGMACVGCAMAPFETLAEVAGVYRADLPTLLRELRALPENGTVLATPGRCERHRRRRGEVPGSRRQRRGHDRRK
jgi:hybrid cluster-associated redox disulfide protein